MSVPHIPGFVPPEWVAAFVKGVDCSCGIPYSDVSASVALQVFDACCSEYVEEGV